MTDDLKKGLVFVTIHKLSKNVKPAKITIWSRLYVMLHVKRLFQPDTSNNAVHQGQSTPIYILERQIPSLSATVNLHIIKPNPNPAPHHPFCVYSPDQNNHVRVSL